MSDNPLVSVIMNCHNGEQFLKDAIQSVFNQSYSNWEIIFWDNASTDESYKIASSYGQKVKLFKVKKKTSLGKARSEAVKKANGLWLAFLDVDDIWLPNKLKSQMAGLVNSDHILSYAGIQEVDQDLSVIRKLMPRSQSGFQLSSQLIDFDITLVTSMINREKLIELELDFDEQMQASEDYNLFIRLLPHGTVFVCNEILALYRIHKESLTYKKIERWSIERRITLNQLLEKNPSLVDSKAFKIANLQSDYYSSCYYMSIGNYRKARNYLFQIRNDDRRYYILWLVSYVPILWNFIHLRHIKIKITKFF